MASPTNSSGLLQVDNDGGGGAVVSAGFTFAAGRDAVLTLSHYGTSTTITGITIGGTAAVLDASRNKFQSSEQSVRIYSAHDMVGGTDEVVFTYSGGSDHYISFSVEEWAEPLTVNADTPGGAESFSNTPAASTSAATTVPSTLVYAVVGVTDNGAAQGLTGPTGWNSVWTEQNNSIHSAGRGAWIEETTTGVKTGTFGRAAANPWGVAIVAYEIGEADTTAPTLSSPSASATSSTTASASVTTDEGNGTLRAVVTTSSTAPSVAQVQAGQDHTGAAAAWSGSQAVSSTGTKTLNPSGLAPNTAYYAHFQHEDAVGNDSAVASSAAFTTYQRAVPTADVSDGTWTPSAGADLFSVLDEAAASDADFITTSAAADSCVVALGSLTDPVSSAGHVVSYRIIGDGASGITVELLQGASVIATWTHDPAPAGWTTHQQTLSGAEADSITDYTALRLRFTEI